MPEHERVLTVVREWVEKAENDLRAAEHLLTIEPDCPTDIACFHAQQCVEKYVKGVLVWKGTAPPRTHDVGAMVGLLPLDLRPELSRQEARRLTEYGTVTRYPGDYEPISLAEARRAMRVARRVRTAVRKLLPDEVRRTDR